MKRSKMVNKRIFYLIASLVLLFIILIPTTDFRPDVSTEENRTNQMLEEAGEAGVSEEYDEYADIRKQMVDTQMRSRNITNENVLAAMEKVPRHKFVTTDFLYQA